MNTEMKIKLISIIPTIVWLAISCPADTHYVSLVGGHSSPFTNGWVSAAIDIQSAIDVATNGDTVLVSNGVYDVGGKVVDDGPTNRVVIDKAITVISKDNNPTNTIIKGYQSGGATAGVDAVRCVYMVSNSTLIGFTLTNGATLAATSSTINVKQYSGGGVYGAASSAVISNCIITKNLAWGNGGGVYNATIFNSMISGNRSWWRNLPDAYSKTIVGGGVCLGVLSNCTVANNQSAQYGGGIGNATAYNCLIVSNIATHGAVIGGSCYRCQILYNNTTIGSLNTVEAYNCLIAYDSGYGVTASPLYNCTIVSNGSGIYCSPNDYIYNSIIYNNTNCNYYISAGRTANFYNVFTTPTNQNLMGGTANWGGGCITNANPQFVSKDTGDWRLRNDSPCINAGTNQNWMTNGVDLDGRTRVRYGTVDMGAYERIYEGTIYKFGF